ncbi:MAG: molybdopterin-dependent oxidoreductase [Burkholderiales bacterium]|nr:molybdopterin-dependent oxidoreductase [Burkholderiales bacterium]
MKTSGPFHTDRRGFLIGSAAATGALVIGVPLLHAGTAGAADASGVEVTHWIVIQPDDTVVIRIARSELGQGSFTGLAMLVAEELECDWSKVAPEYADVNEHVRRNRIWGNMSTGGSRGIRDSHEYVRKAGAAAREMLLTAAARTWDVPVAELSVAKGVVTHAKTGRSTTYGRLAPIATTLEAPKEPKLKDPKDWTLVGTSACCTHRSRSARSTAASACATTTRWRRACAG